MKKLWKKTLAISLSLFMIFEAPLHYPFPLGSSYGAERPATVKATSLNVRSGPGTGYGAVGKLAYGTAVTVTGEATASNGALWYQIRFTGTGGASSTGYVLSSYIQFPTTYSNDANFEAYLNTQGFPESYRPGLRELHARYPQWIFTAVDTGLDWNEVIKNESLVGRNLVSSGSVSSWKSTADGAYDWGSGTWPGFDGSSWVAASEEIIRYYMDPRNFLNETYIFQFLGQSYNASIHTKEGLASLVKGTFLEGSATGSGTWSSGNGGGASQGGSSVPGTYGPGGSGTGGNSQGTGTVIPGAGPGGSGSTAPGAGSGGTASGGSVVISPVTGGGSGGSSGGSNVVIGVPPGGNGSSGNSSPGGTGTSPGPGGQGGSSISSAPGQGGSGTSVSPVQPGHQQGGGVGTGRVPANVQIGVPPGANISQAGEGASGKASQLAGSGLSISPHEVRQVTAKVIRVGPGGEGDSSQTPSSGAGAGESYYTGGTAPYVDILMQAGVESGVNPYVLAAMILQEQGAQGKSESISGASGYYNFFNFEAYASNGMTAVQRGLWYASQAGDYMRPWNSVDKAIIGGACQYGQNYVKAGQNTFYLKKFNVQGSNLYKHQYMTNVEGAAAEGAKMAAAYSETMRQTPLQFMIPVYRNMPGEACQKPVLDGSPNNKLSSISIDGFTITPAFNRDTYYYEAAVNTSVSSVVIRASAIDASAQIHGIGTINLNGTVTDAKLTVTAQNGTIREYTLRITRSNGAPVSNGSTGSPPAGNQASPEGIQNPAAAGTSYGPGGAASGVPSPGSAPSKTGPGSSQGAGGASYNGPGGSNVTIVN